ncbi:unnamed protein product [Paramecium octaurelia]|uniref:Uncharacterized protein n=1 Tax=Paramecium octaurelia TaxID=43137 RepID=A0A8S1YNH5_PAROT|nr:unnamed protein product [Paramecium octaurelia]
MQKVIRLGQRNRMQYLNRIPKQEQNLKLYVEGAGVQICGTVTLTFKFEKDELPYDQKKCIINDHFLRCGEQKQFIQPLDLNIEYCYIVDEKEVIRLDVDDYDLDDISDFEDYQNWDEQNFSRFFVEDFTNSPDNRYIILVVGVDIVNKYETQRLIIIDTFTSNIKKLFSTTHFIGFQKPLFSKDGNLAFINITKSEQSRFLILNLKNGIQEEKIITLPHSIRKIDYDVQSGCLFYVTNNCQIHQQPLNQDGTIDISKEKIYKIDWKQINFFSDSITLTLLSDSIVLLADDSGQLFVFRIRNNCKTVKQYWLKQYIPVQCTFNNKFVVMADTISQYFVLFDILRGKVIRCQQGIRYQSKIDGYRERDSYYLSIVSFSISKNPNDNQVSAGSENDGESKMRKKQSIFDLIRGTEIEINGEDSSNRVSEMFTRNITMRAYDNKFSYTLKL